MTPKPPSARQLNYLKALAHRTGQTFTYPKTSRAASREIQRLKTVRPTSRIELELTPRRRRRAGRTRGQLRCPRRPQRNRGLRLNRDLEPAVMTTPTVTEIRRTATPSASGSNSLATAFPSASASCTASESTAWCGFCRGRGPFSSRSRLPTRTTLVGLVGRRLSRHAPTQHDRNDRNVWWSPRSPRPGVRHDDDVDRSRRPHGCAGRAGTLYGRWVDRALYGQRVLGVVRVTDVPIGTRGRAYLVERGLEQEGPNANAALQALIADYLGEARRLGAVPMSVSLL